MKGILKGDKDPSRVVHRANIESSYVALQGGTRREAVEQVFRQEKTLNERCNPLDEHRYQTYSSCFHVTGLCREENKGPEHHCCLFCCRAENFGFNQLICQVLLYSVTCMYD